MQHNTLISTPTRQSDALQQNNEHETDVWSKKGQSVYWFSVFTPGSASLSREVTALATVMTQAETDTHTESGKG